MEKLARFTLDMEPALHQRLKLLAANRKTTVRAILLEWIAANIEQAEAEQKRKPRP